jgi:hypothetical protein
LTTLLRSVGQALGGEPGARLSQQLGLLTSPTTLLRLVRQTADPQEDAPRIIGIDDFVRPVPSKQAHAPEPEDEGLNTNKGVAMF